MCFVVTHTGVVRRLPDLVETERLTLRLWTENDAPALSEAIESSLDHLRPWMPWAEYEPATLDERVALIRSWRTGWEQGGDSVVGVFKDGDVVGGSGLHRRVGEGGVEIGYWIHVDHLRRGYATETVRGLTEAAFDTPGIQRVEIRHDLANSASARVPERLGFTRVGEFTDEVEAPAEVGVEVRWVKERPQPHPTDSPA